MRFSVLGDLEVETDEGPIRVPGRKERLLLGQLLAARRTVVPVDVLIEALWKGDAPRTAAKSLQAHVVRLRDALEPTRPRGSEGSLIATRPTGYLLQIGREDVDADRFDDLVADARTALATGAMTYAAERLRTALGLWRGPAFAGVESGSVRAEAERLEELRRAAVEDRVEADLETGLAADLVPELEGLVREEPLRERRWGQLALALYRAGRQADALAVFPRARRVLVDELGVDLGPHLQALQAAMLAQDSSLDGTGRRSLALPAALDPVDPLLVGRDRELELLRDAWECARRGQGRIVRLCGEPGSGTTRLAAEVAAEAHRAGGLVLYGSAEPTTSDPVRAVGRLVAPLRLQPTSVAPERQAADRSPVARAGQLASRALLRSSDQGTVAILDDLEGLEPPGQVAVARAAKVLRDGGVLVLLLETGHGQWSTDLPADVQLPLGGVGHAATVQIAELYTGPVDAELAAADIERGEAGGRPGALHELAAAWARRRAGQQLGVATRRVRQQAAQLAISRAELAALVEPARRQAAPRRHAGEARCPYKGLERFDVEDADVFFGREELVTELVGRLVDRPLLAVVGPSGGGKSSVLRAGLLARLAEAALPGSQDWDQIVLRPGEHPYRALADSGATAPTDGARRVVLIDQFEEAFTLAHDVQERRLFLDEVVHMADEGSTSVVLGLRADQLGRLVIHPRLAGLVSGGTVLVGPMAPEELHRAIELPARRVGLRVDPGLANAMVAEILGQPGALPLLSTALVELWEARRDDALDLQVHRATGGVRGAVARLAESTYSQLDADGQAVARRIVLRMVAVGTGDIEVRRRLPVDEIAHEGPQGAEVLQQLAERRLVTLDGATAELSHEALLREWPRLRGWLDDDRQGRALHRHLTEAARAWDTGGRDSADLYRGPRLAAALAWVDEHPSELNTLEDAFVASSRDASDRERHEALERAARMSRVNRRLTHAVSAAVVLLVVALVAAGVAVLQGRQAAARALAADAARVGAQALVEEDLDRSLLLAVQAHALDDSVDTRGALLEALTRSPDAVTVFRGDGERYMDADISPDGRLVAAASSDGSLTVWDTDTHERIQRIDATASSWAVDFSPDGTQVVVAGWGQDDRGLVRLFDTGTFEELWNQTPPIGGFRMNWSRDSSRLSGMGFDGVPMVFDAATGQMTRLEHVDAPDSEPWGAVFATDRNTVVAVYAGQSLLVDAATGQERRRLPFGGPLTISPDGHTFAFGEWDAPDRRVVLVDPASGQVRRELVRHTSEVQDLVFTPDGQRLLTSGDDGIVVSWDLAGDEPAQVLQGHHGRVWGLGVTNDGETLVSGSLDGSLIAWDLSGGRRFGRPTSPSDVGMSAAATPDGRYVVGVQPNGVMLHDRETGRTRDVVLDDDIWAVAVRPDGLAAAAGAQGQVHLIDVTSGDVQGEPLAPEGRTIGSLEFVDDGEVLLAGTETGAVVGWRTADWREVARVEHDSPVWATALDPAGSRLAASLEDGTVAITLWPDGAPIAHIPPTGAGPEQFVTFDATGHTLATGGRSGSLRLWDAATGNPIGDPVRTVNGWIISGDLQDDLLVLGGADGSITLFDLATRRVLGGPLPVGNQVWVFPAFLPDGDVLALAEAGRAVIYEVDADRWARRACEVAGRVLTNVEWRIALPQRRYAPACAP